MMGKKSIATKQATDATIKASLDAAITLLIREDGDRDHMNHSNITCEQSMAIVRLLQCLASQRQAIERETVERAIDAANGERVFPEIQNEGDDAYNMAIGHVVNAIRSLIPTGEKVGSEKTPTR